MKKILPLILSLFLYGCAGGGGSVHVPPEHIKSGAPIELVFELSAWGAGSGKLDRRYTGIKCHYRDISKTDFQTVHAKVVSADEKRMKAVMTIPAETIVGASEIDYYFDFFFDGVYNRQNKEPLRIQK